MSMPTAKSESQDDDKGAAIITGVAQGTERAIPYWLTRDGFNVALNDVAVKAAQLAVIASEMESQVGTPSGPSEAEANAELEAKDDDKRHATQPHQAEAGKRHLLRRHYVKQIVDSGDGR